MLAIGATVVSASHDRELRVSCVATATRQRKGWKALLARRGARGSLACDLVTPLRSALVDALLLGKLGKLGTAEMPFLAPRAVGACNTLSLLLMCAVVLKVAAAPARRPRVRAETGWSSSPPPLLPPSCIWLSEVEMESCFRSATGPRAAGGGFTGLGLGFGGLGLGFAKLGFG